jgi:hypothetical protein
MTDFLRYSKRKKGTFQDNIKNKIDKFAKQKPKAKTVKNKCWVFLLFIYITLM